MFNKSGNSGFYTKIDVTEKTINEANSVNLLEILKQYNVDVDVYNRKYPCPFYFHKNGMERSASFYYYPESNSFFCFGCKSGGKAVDFVALCENITRYTAAISILNNFETNSDCIIERTSNYNKIYLDFSHLVRSFILHHKDNEKALNYAEYVCSAFDNIRAKYSLDDNGLQILYKKLVKKLEEFK